jgi:hypothetical protein
MAGEARLEPYVRAPELRDTLQARVHDPLWLLARQLQLGAFWASQGGTPARTELSVDSAPLSRYAPVGAAPRDYDPGKLPLEALVEGEPPPPLAPALPFGLRARAGLHFLRLLAAHGAQAHADAYRRLYALEAPANRDDEEELDGRSARMLDVLAGRVPDGAKLHVALAAALGPRGDGAAFPPELSATDRPKVLAAAREWLRWAATQGMSGVPGGAWLPERMEYAFAVSARGAGRETVLAAREYLGGRLDWDAFVLRPEATLGASAGAAARSSRPTPTPVRYRGMPSPRLWEFEDARVNLAAVEVKPDAPGRLAQLLLLEFALVYGNDWFVVPLETRVGSISRIASLVVTDTFGEQTRVEHVGRVDGPGAPWRMFALTVEGGAPADDVFFLPPSLGPSLSARPHEEVLFLRDEMANVAWAVERVVEADSGLPLDRYEAYHERRQRVEAARAEPAAKTADGASRPALAYRLGSSVPDYWIPLVPEQADGELRLRRGRMPDFADGGRIEPRGRLLEPGMALRLYEEEVPREGARVTRAYQYARWLDGSSHLWIGRRKRPGRGEGSSGLRFDYLEEAT